MAEKVIPYHLKERNEKNFVPLPFPRHYLIYFDQRMKELLPQNEGTLTED